MLPQMLLILSPTRAVGISYQLWRPPRVTGDSPAFPAQEFSFPADVSVDSSSPTPASDSSCLLPSADKEPRQSAGAESKELFPRHRGKAQHSPASSTQRNLVSVNKLNREQERGGGRARTLTVIPDKDTRSF